MSDVIQTPQPDAALASTDMTTPEQRMFNVLSDHKQNSLAWIERLQSEHEQSRFRIAGRWAMNHFGIQTPTQNAVAHHSKIAARDMEAEARDYGQRVEARENQQFNAGVDSSADEHLAELKRQSSSEIDELRAQSSQQIALAQKELSEIRDKASESVVMARHDAIRESANSLQEKKVLTPEAEAALRNYQLVEDYWQQLSQTEYPQGSIESLLKSRDKDNLTVYFRLKEKFAQQGIDAETFNSIYVQAQSGRKDIPEPIADHQN